MLTLEMIKPFASKSETRPILTSALVTQEHYIATDSHRLIRAAHGQNFPTSFLHSFHGHQGETSSYPDVSRLMPDPSDAKSSCEGNVKEWLDAHKALLPIAKIDGGKLCPNVKITSEGVTAEAEKPAISATAKLFANIADDKMYYNCQYMIDALTLLHKLKVPTFIFRYYGHLRPFVIEAIGIELLILPVRSYK